MQNIFFCSEWLHGAGLKQIIMNVNWQTCLQSGEITSHYKHIMFQAIPHSGFLLMMWVNSLNMSLMGRGFSLYKMVSTLTIIWNQA